MDNAGNVNNNEIIADSSVPANDEEAGRFLPANTGSVELNRLESKHYTDFLDISTWSNLFLLGSFIKKF